MLLRYRFKSTFQKAFDKLTQEKQNLTLKALKSIDQILKGGEGSYGLRIKKLYTGGQGKIFEARVDIDLRLVWVQTKEEVIFTLLGNHNEVRQFLKNL